MEVHKRFLTILTPQGEFLRARNLKKIIKLDKKSIFSQLNKGK